MQVPTVFSTWQGTSRNGPAISTSPTRVETQCPTILVDLESTGSPEAVTGRVGVIWQGALDDTAPGGIRGQARVSYSRHSDIESRLADDISEARGRKANHP